MADQDGNRSTTEAGTRYVSQWNTDSRGDSIYPKTSNVAITVKTILYVTVITKVLILVVPLSTTDSIMRVATITWLNQTPNTMQAIRIPLFNRAGSQRIRYFKHAGQISLLE